MKKEIELVGSKIISVGYSYGSLVEIRIEQPDGTRERIAFGITIDRFDDLKNWV